MAQPQFLTVPDEIVALAELTFDFFKGEGFKVKVEPLSKGFPYSPTLTCKRQNTTLVVEITSRVEFKRLEDWLRYAKAQRRDIRVVNVLPRGFKISQKAMSKLRTLGIGVRQPDNGNLIEILIAQDLPLDIQLPRLAQMPMPVRSLLGPAYDQFSKAQWREGFEDACQALETEARNYLRKSLRGGGRFVLRDGRGRIRNLTIQQINKLTLGQLARAYSQIQSPSHKDSLVAGILNNVNKDRVGVAHHKASAATEVRLRRNVETHMWDIIQALRALVAP